MLTDAPRDAMTFFSSSSLPCCLPSFPSPHFPSNDPAIQSSLEPRYLNFDTLQKKTPSVFSIPYTFTSFTYLIQAIPNHRVTPRYHTSTFSVAYTFQLPRSLHFLASLHPFLRCAMYSILPNSSIPWTINFHAHSLVGLREMNYFHKCEVFTTKWIL